MIAIQFWAISCVLGDCEGILCDYSVPPGFCDSAITEFIAKSSKLRNFHKSSQIFVSATDFPHILGLDASPYVIALCIVK